MRRLRPSARRLVERIGFALTPVREGVRCHRRARLLLRQMPERIGCHVDLVGPNDIGAVFTYPRLPKQFG